jgi:hypothetical protein
LIGVVALVFAIAGGVALANVPNNSVGTKKIKNGAVTTKKIKNGAVTRAKIRNNAVNGAKVANGSLTGADLAADSVTGTQINESSLNITLPAPPPSAIQTVGTRLAGNQSATISAGSFTVTVATDASGNCNVWQISASEAGAFVENDLENATYQNDGGTDAIGAGDTDNLDAINNNDAAGPIYALADDGTGNGVFTVQTDTVNNRCNVSMTGIST